MQVRSMTCSVIDKPHMITTIMAALNSALMLESSDDVCFTSFLDLTELIFGLESSTVFIIVFDVEFVIARFILFGLTRLLFFCKNSLM